MADNGWLVVIQPIRTERVSAGGADLLSLLDRYVEECPERSILAVTSKLIALCQGRIVDAGAASKEELIARESNRYLRAEANRYGVALTIKGGRLIPTAGIDESNAGGHYVLWPVDIQAVANQIRGHLRARFGRRSLGVIITDSTTAPLRVGVVGIAIAHSGFLALHDYVGTPDLFGRPLRMTKANVAEGLAAAAVLVMGEGSEQTPMARLTDLPFVTFQDSEPGPAELAALRIAPEDDLYGALLEAVPWSPGEGE